MTGFLYVLDSFSYCQSINAKSHPVNWTLGRLSFLWFLYGYQLALGAVVSPGSAIQETLPGIGSIFWTMCIHSYPA